MTISPAPTKTIREELDNLRAKEQDGNVRIAIISTLSDLADKLEATLEQMRKGSASPQSPPRSQGLHLEQLKQKLSMNANGHRIFQDLLGEIATVHRERATRMLDLHSSYHEGWENCNASPFSVDDIDEALLRWAISSKRAARISDYVNALLKRNELFPRYEVTDAIRFLGCVKQEGDSELNSFQVLEIEKTGIFALNEDGQSRCRPTQTAIELGKNVRNIFRAHDYTLPHCRSFVLPFLTEEALLTKEPIVSANGFFLHRQEILSENDVNQATSDANYPESDFSPLSILVHLFLFGIARSQKAVEAALGEDATSVLLEAGLLSEVVQPTLSDKPSWLVGEVMIYPIHGSDFQLPKEQLNRNPTGFENSPCLFMTDWPLESLRLPRDAVMPIGDDSLELMALASGAELCVGSEEEYLLLDMCCGSGIQGIFALFFSPCALHKSGKTSEGLRLVSADINKRAIHFVTANLALNMTDVLDESFAICGNLFDEDIALRFNRILCNPPFVPDALPECRSHAQLEPARYAVGGGSDGMKVLRGFLSMCFSYLKTANYSVFMVTELPNIKKSCSLLRSYIPSDFRDQVRICVAYVEEDVEQIAPYSKNREEEAGEEVCDRDWHDELSHKEVYDRALALVSILPRNFNGNCEKEDISMLYKFSSGRTSTGIDRNYEEDAFLSPEGISFVRRKLL